MTLWLTGASVLFATLPMVGMLGLVWWLDRYDREPPWLVASVFGWGAVGAVLLATPAAGVLHALLFAALDSMGAPGWLLERVGVWVVAPLAEEPAKAVALAFVLFHRHFDNMTDGFVYGAAAGLGFGMSENLWYFLSLTDDLSSWGSMVALRTFYSAVMHAMCTAILGACAGHARFRKRPVFLGWSAFGLGLAVSIHVLWNALASGPSEGWFVVDLVVLPLELVAVAVVFELCVSDEARTIRHQLVDEVQRGLLPPDHPGILASWTRRTRRDWLPAHVDHDRYVRLATTLAMRKQQLEDQGTMGTIALDTEVRELREALRALRLSGWDSEPVHDPAGGVGVKP